jgi:ferrochelatase
MKEFKGNDFDLLYSAHSLPQSFIDEGDPYLDHIKFTIELVNRRLSSEPSNMRNLKWHLSFQSKTGPVKWLEPTTEETIIRLAKEGCKNLFVVPISFVSDHIETLYEIDILYNKLAEKHGITLKRCRSLNTSGKFILAMKQLIMDKIDS